MSPRVVDPSRTRQRAKTAATWLRRAAAHLRADAEQAPTSELRWLAGYDAKQLLDAVLDGADSLAQLVNEEDLDDALRAAETVRARLKNRRLAAKLANVAGRTPDEAAAFRAKAEQLTAPP